MGGDETSQPEGEREERDQEEEAPEVVGKGEVLQHLKLQKQKT